MKEFIVFVLVLIVATAGRADEVLADQGKTQWLILIDAGATASERTAAGELASTLYQITGAEFLIRTNSTIPARAIFVGAGEAARKAFADVPFDTLGTEELVIRMKGSRLL